MQLGKPDRRLMANTICRLAGAKNPEVIIGPKQGVDVSVLKISPGQVMISSSDPISLIPRIGPEKSAELSVHGIASDVATSGLAPKYASFDLNLPPSLSDNLLKRYWKSVHKTCRKLGVAILGGHTGRFEGCDYSVIGGATMFAIGEEDNYVTSSMATQGDSLIATKSAAIEAAAVLSTCFPHTVKCRLGGKVARQGLSLMNKVSTVRDALIVGPAGLRDRGVTAMHDVTEGGVLSAVLELADASRLNAVVDAASIPVYNEVREICSLFRTDPLISLGEGSLLIASRPEYAEEVVRVLERRQIGASVIGRLTKKGRSIITDNRGREKILSYPKEDPYWKAYWHGIRKHLR